MESAKPDVVLCLSGGMDSTTLLYDLRSQGRSVTALGFDYGQRHSRELRAAESVARAADISFEIVQLKDLARLFQGSALTDRSVAVPHGHYTDATMKSTVVPNRNMIFLSIAAGHAMAQGIRTVAFAAHAGDHTIYPDCRPEFISALGSAIQLADWHPAELIAPFMHLSKTEICRRGAQLKVPFELTWSCYEGGDLHCGQCGTCIERREAFAEAGVEDPTQYATGE